MKRWPKGGRQGIVFMKARGIQPRIARHAEPAAESSMETRLRMLLVLSGLPRPQAPGAPGAAISRTFRKRLPKRALEAFFFLKTWESRSQGRSAASSWATERASARNSPCSS
jgi:hypothetical protein